MAGNLVIFSLGFCLLNTTLTGESPRYDLLIRSGHVIDPKNQIDDPVDIAIREGKIAQVGSSITPSESAKVVEASGLYVVLGLLDIHAHVFFGTEEDAAYSNRFSAIPPDRFTFRSGVTTVVNAGGAGWRNFTRFKRQAIDHSLTRVLAFINIVGSGMKGGPIEQDLNDTEPRLTRSGRRSSPGLSMSSSRNSYAIRIGGRQLSQTGSLVACSNDAVP
jgi:dihydroorotase